MASAADKAEQRVHEQRRLIEQKLTRLEARVKDDLSTAQTATRERTNDVTQSIPGRHRIERQVEQRPLTSIAAGLAAGIGLGMLSESISVRGNGGSSDGRGAYDRRYEPRPEADRSGSDRSGMMGWIAGPAAVAILGPIQDQIQEFVSSALSGITGRGDSQRREGHSEGQLAGSPSTPRESQEMAAARPEQVS